MAGISEITYVVGPSVVSRTVGDETVLVDLDTETWFSLDRIGTVVWGELENAAPASAIVAVLTARFDVSAERADRDVRALLADLARAGLVRPAEG